MHISAANGGLVVLNGGDEFHPGNEPQDEFLVEAAGSGPAYVVPTAAARGNPGLAVATARGWFARLGLHLVELPVLTRSDARREHLVEMARGAAMLYLVGGDPGLVVSVLRDTPVWAAMVEAWSQGAALAGSSAGAMALGEVTLIRDRRSGADRRRAAPALGLVRGIAVVPHRDRFGGRWSDQPIPGAEGVDLLGLDERTAAVWDGSVWRARGAGQVSFRGAEAREGSLVPGLPAPRSQPAVARPERA